VSAVQFVQSTDLIPITCKRNDAIDCPFSFHVLCSRGVSLGRLVRRSLGEGRSCRHTTDGPQRLHFGCKAASMRSTVPSPSPRDERSEQMAKPPWRRDDFPVGRDDHLRGGDNRTVAADEHPRASDDHSHAREEHSRVRDKLSDARDKLPLEVGVNSVLGTVGNGWRYSGQSTRPGGARTDRLGDMARPLRVEFAGAAYHVMARGNERKAIFRDDQDRQRFLETLAEMVERFGARVQAYCLMPNHYHLLLDTPRANLSQAVGWLQVTYTVRFNRRHRRSGHLFQGRFKAQLIEADQYARGLVEYVHLNPVRLRCRNERLAPERAEELDRYRWSSHRAYGGLDRKPPGWLSQHWLRYWGEKPTNARREYRKSLARWFDKELENPWDNLIGGLVLGGEVLLARVHAQLKRKKAEEETRWLQRCRAAEPKNRLGEWLGSEADERIQIWARVRLAGERCAAVARQLGYYDGSGVGQVVRRLERRSVQDVELRKRLTKIRANMSRVLS